MKKTTVWLSLGLLLACKQNPMTNIGKADARGSTVSRDAQVVETPIAPADNEDDEEEEIALEPAVIGGAYLFCDGQEDSAGCRLGNVPESQWLEADKQPDTVNLTDGSGNACPIVVPEPGNPYQLILEADSALQNVLELQLSIKLPQGNLKMTTTVSPFSADAVTQRLGQGIPFYAAKSAGSDVPGLDRKTWNLWMPVKIPQTLSNFSQTIGTAELLFDQNVCSYRSEDGEAFRFESCSKDTWQKGKPLRVRSVTLRVAEGSAGALLETIP